MAGSAGPEYGDPGGSSGGPQDIDPADQWIYDPASGSYQLHLTPGQPVGDEQPTAVSEASARVPGQRGSGSTDAAGHGTAGSVETPRTSDSPVHPSPNDPDAPQDRIHNRDGAGLGQGGRAERRRQNGRGTGRKAGWSRRRKVTTWAAGSLGFLLVLGGTGGFLVYQHFNNNIDKLHVNPGSDRPAGADGPMNILVIGTDSRKGLGKKYGDAGSVGHADTTILYHVAEDRSNATAVSIPRDLKTDIPECQTGDKTIPPERNASFNTSLGQDGRDPGCTWRTVEKLMDVRVDHFMMVDFNAVKTLSKAVGGVEVCAGKDIDDPKSHLHMKAGRHTVQGEDALAFVRTRHAVGLGGDLTRIPLQQQFLSSLLRKIQSSGTLTSPSKLWHLAEAATDALTVDDGIGSINKLKNLAQDLGEVDTKNITFTTVPVVDDPQDNDRVILTPGKAQRLFSMVKHDTSLTKVKKEKAKEDAKKRKNSPAAKVRKAKAAPAAQVRAKIVNGSGVTGQAQSTIEWLQNEKGFVRASNGLNASQPQARTVLRYAPGQESEAHTLMKAFGLPSSALKPSSSRSTADGADQQLRLVLGKDFKKPGTPIAGDKNKASEKGPDGLQRVQADDKNACAK